MPINDKSCLEERYDDWNADNKEQILNHINARHSIFLHSKYGRGKTHFLKWLSKRYNEQGHWVYYSMFANTARRIREEIDLRRNGIYKTRIEDVMKDCKILCLDDCGNENMTANTHELLITVINHRYEHKKPTFITSNYSPKELARIYATQIGEVKAGQLVSRILTFGSIELQSKNYRQETEY
jgi:DNA replication protein DnaC